MICSKCGNLEELFSDEVVLIFMELEAEVLAGDVGITDEVLEPIFEDVEYFQGG